MNLSYRYICSHIEDCNLILYFGCGQVPGWGSVGTKPGVFTESVNVVKNKKESRNANIISQAEVYIRHTD